MIWEQKSEFILPIDKSIYWLVGQFEKGYEKWKNLMIWEQFEKSHDLRTEIGIYSPYC